jgi:hypothetical protein
MLTNTPQDTLILEIEQRKSFAFGLWVQETKDKYLDIAGAEFTFTVGKPNRDGSVDFLFSVPAYAEVAIMGYTRFNLQASDLDLKAGTYKYNVTMISGGYSTVMLRGDIKLLPNTEYASIDEVYDTNNAAQQASVLLRQNDVHVTIDYTLPPDLLRIPGGGVQGDVLSKSGPGPYDLVWTSVNGSLSAAGVPANYVPMADGFNHWTWKQAVVPLDLANETSARIDADNAIVANEVTRDNATRTWATSQDNIVAGNAASDATAKMNLAKNYSDTQDTAQTASITTAYQSYVAGYVDPRLLTYGNVTGINADGTCTVMRDSGSPVSNVLSIRGYIPYVGDRVYMGRGTDTKYTILGRNTLRSWRLNSLIALTAHRDYGTDWCFGQACLTSDGFAILQGLVIPSSGAIAASTLLFTLPPELRPDIPSTAYIMVQANFSDTAASLYVYGNGEVRNAIALSAGQYISFTGLRWPTAAAGLVWTDVAPQGTANAVAFVNGWSKFAGGSSLNPRWALDSWGCFWIQGMVTNASAAPTTNTGIIGLTSALAPDNQGHHICVGNGGIWGFVGWDNGLSGHSALAINFKTGTNWGANGYLSLSGVVMPIATNTITWKQPEVAGWSPYGSIFNNPAFGMRGEIAITRGLYSMGTAGTAMFMIDRSFRPKPLNALSNLDSGYLQNQPSGDARGRVDITPNGQMVGKTGTAWMTLDGLMWIPEIGTT